MHIEFGRGLDHILFGMTESEIVAALGTPDKTVITESGNRDLCYYCQKLILKIEPTNGGRLGWVSVRNRQARLADLDPWTTERGALLEHLEQELAEPYAVEDYGELESISFERSWVELQYELGELAAINFGVRYGYNDEPHWPPPAA